MNTEDWYSAVTLYESSVEGVEDDICEVRLILVRADTEEEAVEKVTTQARKTVEAYENAEGQRVAWHFKGVLAVKQLYLETIRDGDEVFSEYLRRDEVKELRRMLTSRL